ncbi:hypothetical protein [Spiroplasma melliferum]|nr:hypothetical protein [Spiroplasma melliferum]
MRIDHRILWTLESIAWKQWELLCYNTPEVYSSDKNLTVCS